MRIRSILLGAITAFVAAAALAQTVPVPSKNLSGTITTTNTFQLVQSQSANRLGCTIQNNATAASGDVMWVFFGSTPSKAAAVQLAPGQSVSCVVEAAIVVSDPVYITGTAGDAFYANFE